MLISTKGRYALRVMIDLAEHQTEGYIPLKTIAQRQGISEKYLEGIIKLLVKAQLLNGVRGKGGGYRLTKVPEQYTAGEILRLTEDSLAPVACLEPGASACSRAAECRTLSLWQGLDKAISSYLDGITLADLMRRGDEGDDYVIWPARRNFSEHRICKNPPGRFLIFPVGFLTVISPGSPQTRRSRTCPARG